MDPGVLPSWYILTTAFKFCRNDATRESYVAALFDCSNVPNIRVIQPWLIKLPPDGSNDAFEISLRLFLHYSWKNIIGCAPSTPDGSSPQGYSRKNLISSIGSKTLCLLSCHQIVALLNSIIGCAVSAPDGSSPRGYSQKNLGIDSKNEFSFADLFVPFYQFFVDFLGHHQYSNVTSDIFLNVLPTSVHHCHSPYFPLLECSWRH
jgi:hypothetical protein